MNWLVKPFSMAFLGWLFLASMDFAAYEAAGVAGCHLEDQVFPKRCGHMKGKEVIPADEMVQKIRAAADARSDPDFVIRLARQQRATCACGPTSTVVIPSWAAGARLRSMIACCDARRC